MRRDVLTPYYISDIVSRIQLPFGWKLEFRTAIEGMYLQVGDPKGVDGNGQPYPWRGRKWRLSPHMTKSEVVQTAFAALMAAVEHEAREQFLYMDRAIFHPHYDVDRLHALCGEQSSSDARHP